MAVTAFTGIQGAGKTFHVVYRLSIDKIAEQYYIIHNIDGLQPDLISEKFIGKSFEQLGAKSLEEGFTVKFLAPIAKAATEKYGRPILVIVDEAWRVLRAANVHFEETLAWHRHEGMDLWLIFQSELQVHKNYKELIQSQWRADNPYITLPGFFQYKRIVQQQIIGRKKIKKNKAVYLMYKSREREGGQQEKSKIFIYAAALVCITAVMFVYMAGWGIRDIFGTKRAEAKQTVSSIKPVNVPRGTVQAPPPPPPPPKPISPTNNYTFSACVGNRVLMQSERGRIVELEEIYEHYRLLECTHRKAVVMIEGKVTEVRKKTGFINVNTTNPDGAGGAPVASEGAHAGGMNRGFRYAGKGSKEKDTAIE